MYHMFLQNDDCDYFYIVLREELYESVPDLMGIKVNNKHELNVSKSKFNYIGLDLLMKYLSINPDESSPKSNIDLN